MRINARSLAIFGSVSVVVLAAACRGGPGAHDTLALDSDGWSEPAVFGFADAAFTTLAKDGELGSQAARRAPVRQLATRMQRDYRALAARADSLSERRSVVPRSPSGSEFFEQHRAASADLLDMDRRQFDDRYLDHVMTGHQRVMDRLYEALSAAQDESVRRLLEDAQQRLEANLGEATRLKSSSAGSTGARRRT